jgi:hypothetical protein
MKWKPSFSGFKQAFKFDHDLWDPSHRFETSWLLSPWALFAARALIVRLCLILDRATMLMLHSPYTPLQIYFS